MSKNVEKKTENTWLNLGFNIILPSLLLIKGTKILEYFGVAVSWCEPATLVFCVALFFPIAYGIYDLYARRKWNIISIIGIASVVLTGGIGLLRFSREWMIVKEGAVPLLLGAAVLISAFTSKPLVKILLMNDSVIDTEKVETALNERNCKDEFSKALKKATYILAFSFVLSSVLNFLLAAYIFQSPTGTEAFNEEVGKMTALSFPVIVLPTMIIFIYALFRLFADIKKLTGLGIEELMHAKN